MMRRYRVCSDLSQSDTAYITQTVFDNYKVHVPVTATVLIIDDAVHIRRLAARMLERAGFATLEAGNGLQGLKALQEKKPDIVTCDISMPLMDGHEFLTAAKADVETRQIPVIIITAIGQEDEVARAMELGANAYLTKPFSSSSLVETVQTQLNQLPK